MRLIKIINEVENGSKLNVSLKPNNIFCSKLMGVKNCSYSRYNKNHHYTHLVCDFVAVAAVVYTYS